MESSFQRFRVHQPGKCSLHRQVPDILLAVTEILPTLKYIKVL